ncbi:MULTISPECIES: rhodanese-like domain-containing protein [Catenuloplanes]|uniref:Rhodanese-related sulfurtransferase n=1 Tax=Catenuloplanes niger TaxID=587534 RepID=A0AAE3ZZ83_9ACTN|nr:rhodanese-like domain-containing protein [Catenuloplanes niger]MDR7327650.1 rhodanese-related sulfurtransferase [Catenuloplanes niger]
MREVDLATFTERHRNGAVVIDVRETFEYWTGHVPGAVRMPLGQVAVRAGELPKDRPVYVICASGSRSLTAAARLHRSGIDAWSVRGGTSAWQRAGHPVVRGRRAA